MEKLSIAETLYNGSSAENSIEEFLYDEGIEFEKIGWDDYDNSLEIYNVVDSVRLNEKQQKYISD